jgi:formylglycine-generating enzyme required for sulfatase activity
MLATEVTQAMWVEEMGSNPSNNNDGDASLNHPVEKVTWNQAQGFVSNLNSKNDGYQYRLPSGAEWGYAARAGNKGAYFFGDDVKHLKDVAWFADNSDHHTHAVASTSNDNGFGLWDMHGNVAEWVADAYSEKNDGRVIRGGSYSDEAKLCRSVSRDSGWPGDLHEDVGFRIVRTKR